MKNISENFQFKTIDSDLGDKKRFENNPLFYSGKILPSSKGEINIDNSNQNNQSLIFNNSNGNTTLSSQDNNTSYFSLKENEYYLYGNDFSLFNKPQKLGMTRNCIYIKGYPIISFGKSIFYPLLLIFFICILYIIIYTFFFNESGKFLKKLFNYFFVAYLISHILAIFINPGIPSYKYNQIIKNNISQNKTNKFNFSKCKKCKLYYKLVDNIGHCNKCNICYFDYSRHSFWISHCIGKNNKLLFICFVLSFWTFIMLCLTMILVKILKMFFIKQ